tara:strand:+ start:337 stop:549 length:213 start_codon:yes stop_codon:yes gene_type:complete
MTRRKNKKISRAKTKEALNNLDYKRLAYNWSDIDWDLGWDSIGKYNKKLIWRQQQRKWRTWKYNRKTQYK